MSSRPISKVLVINDEALILRDLLKGLNAAARALDNPFGIAFVGALTAKEALALIERDGALMLFNWLAAITAAVFFGLGSGQLVSQLTALVQRWSGG